MLFAGFKYHANYVTPELQNKLSSRISEGNYLLHMKLDTISKKHKSFAELNKRTRSQVIDALSPIKSKYVYDLNYTVGTYKQSQGFEC